MSETTYLLDTNTLIAPHRRYYRFSFCPGFWSFLQLQFEHRESTSILKVYNEIVRNSDLLSDWLKTELDKKLFIDEAHDDSTVSRYDDVATWVMGNDQFYDSAKRDFLRVEAADPWLCAYAAVYGLTVVTEEVTRPDAHNRVSLANVLDQFNVPYIGIFDYLERQQAKFVMAQQ